MKVEAGHRCAIPTCRQHPVEIAHIEPRKADGSNDVFENLIALCPTCHTRYDNSEIDRLAMRQYKLNLGIVMNLDRNLTRPNNLIVALNQFRIKASPWVKVLYEPTDNAFSRAADFLDFSAWVEEVAKFIRTNMDEAEEHSFRNAGIPKQPVHELEDKLEYIRDKLIPKVREGYW